MIENIDKMSDDFLDVIKKHMKNVKYDFEEKLNRQPYAIDHSQNLPKKVLNKIKTKQVGEIAGFKVWLVNAEIIRDELDVDFTNGGNPARYTYVPNKEIWIEDGLKISDITPTLLHEITETLFMLKEKSSYDKAHDLANQAEKPFRKAIDNKNFKLENNIVDNVKKWITQ